MDDQAKVLIVDDDPYNVDLLQQMIEDLEYKVVTATNGKEALIQVANTCPDVILLDIMMPEMDGFQVLEHLKENKAWRDIPTIVISARNDINSVVKGITMGAEDYLSKPIDEVLLKARIGACLEKKQLRDQIKAEKEFSEKLLHAILPYEVVREFKVTGTAKPRLYQNVAVLFADVVGFTSYCDTHVPEKAVSNLQALVEAYEDLALHYDLQEIKTIGDAFMAVGGLLRPLDNPVLNCVRCGQKMITTVHQLQAEWHVRVGIHVGPVMAGVIGRRQFLFDLWGDTVNTAYRIESNGAVDSVNLSKEAWLQVSEQCRSESLGLIPMKGKGDVEIHRIECILDEMYA